MTTTTTSKPTRPEDERLPLASSYAYGMQHILTMYGGVIAPPLIVGGAAGLTGLQIGLLVSAALFVSGLATILQSAGLRFFGSQLPLVQGISFASVSTMTAVATGSGGLPAVFGAIIVAGLVGLAISPFFSQVVRFFPPVVNGTIITVIGVSLLPVAVRWAMGGNAKAPGYGSVTTIALAAFTLGVILVLTRLVQGPISRLSILLGIVVGTGFAALLGKADFSGSAPGPSPPSPGRSPSGPPRSRSAPSSRWSS
jgi:NCS2 family nucleobase:cation symporter-2